MADYSVIGHLDNSNAGSLTNVFNGESLPIDVLDFYDAASRLEWIEFDKNEHKTDQNALIALCRKIVPDTFWEGVHENLEQAFLSDELENVLRLGADTLLIDHEFLVREMILSSDLLRHEKTPNNLPLVLIDILSFCDQMIYLQDKVDDTKAETYNTLLDRAKLLIRNYVEVMSSFFQVNNIVGIIEQHLATESINPIEMRELLHKAVEGE